MSPLWPVPVAPPSVVHMHQNAGRQRAEPPFPHHFGQTYRLTTIRCLSDSDKYHDNHELHDCSLLSGGMSGSESSDDADLPSAAECDIRCKSFAAITETDTACAMFFLQDVHWDVQLALDAYYETTGKGKPPPGGNPAVAAVTSSGDHAGCSPEDSEPHRIRLLSWNTDGIDSNNVLTRARAVRKIIVEEKPHVVFLQEVVLSSLQVFEKLCDQYTVVASKKSSGYFCVILLRTESVTLKGSSIYPFFSSTMGRNLLHVKATVKGIEMDLMTSHLESMVGHSEERKRQLQHSFTEVQDAPEGSTVVFGGDLNLRDKELAALGGLPVGLVDLWAATGERPEAKFTWDTKKNDNLDMGLNFKPRCRFDRLYLRQPKTGPRTLKPVYFELVGIQRIEACKRFPSDHWGILTHFDKVDMPAQ